MPPTVTDDIHDLAFVWRLRITHELLDRLPNLWGVPSEAEQVKAVDAQSISLLGQLRNWHLGHSLLGHRQAVRVLAPQACRHLILRPIAETHLRGSLEGCTLDLDRQGATVSCYARGEAGELGAS